MSSRMRRTSWANARPSWRLWTARAVSSNDEVALDQRLDEWDGARSGRHHCHAGGRCTACGGNYSNALDKRTSSLLKNPRHSECIVIQFFYHESAGAGMRGAFMDQGGLFSYIAPEARVPANHPLRKIRELVRDVLGELNRSLGKLYASEGRPSIPPEQ